MLQARRVRPTKAVGYVSLDQLANATESEIASLHGMGPKAIRLLRDALAERGLAFRSE
ncbi:MAG: DNA-binding protein [Coriobacteriia bacterium]|nr:DNA-binding protein [Coriobacteriia bacterium]